MIKLILKAFLLMTLIVAVGFATVTQAQQPATPLRGEWVGNREPRMKTMVDWTTSQVRRQPPARR
jgi:hypothetical protein